MNEIEPIGNFFREIPEDLTEEVIQVISKGKNVRIERIISKGQKSPKDFWYDQEQSEWVMLLQGYAELTFEGNPQSIKLKAGDYLNIPAHKKHRVEMTDEKVITIWLAIFYD
jgi:cupin 2 domain-containing protein